MNIFEIKREFADLVNSAVDPETGECILDEARFDELQMAFDEKVQNTAKYYRNEEAFIKDLKEQRDMLDQRITYHTNVKNRLGKLLDYALDGQTYETPEVLVKSTKSQETVIDDEEQFLEWCASNDRLTLLTFKPAPTPTPNKAEIKKCLKANEEIPFCHIQEKRNIKVK